MGQTRYTLTAIALRGLTVLPKMMIHFDISRTRSVAAVEKAMVEDQKVFLITQRRAEVMEPDQGDLYQVGCVAVVRQLVKMPDNIVRVMVEGLERAELAQLEEEGPYLSAEVEAIPAGMEAEQLDYVTAEAMVRIVKDKMEEYGRIHPRMTKDILPNLQMISDLEELLDQTAIQLPWDYTLRQDVLESIDLTERYEHVVHSLITEIQIARIKQDFQVKVKAAIDKNQKEYILREQLRIIRQELGEDNVQSDADEYQKQVKALKADREVKDKLLKEINRLKGMPGGSQEGNVIRTYIETLLELPWKKTSLDNNDIRHAEQILNEDNYGLDKGKERSLE